MSNDSSSRTGENASGPPPTETALDLIGYPEQVRGQTVHAGIQTGVIDCLATESGTATELASDLDLDRDYVSRLLRALSVYGLLDNDEDGQFTLTPVGERFLPGHSESVRDLAMYFYHPDRLSAIRHLPDVITHGEPTGYEVEFEYDLFEHCNRHPEFARHFNGFQDLMNTFGRTEQILDAIDDIDFSEVSSLCDVGGGYGILLCHLLEEYPHVEGMVPELPSVLKDADRLWASRLGVEERCTYITGDMFESIPEADAIVLKDVLHDWSDEDCIQILSNAHTAAPGDGHLFVIERPLSEADPNPEIIDMDMVMMLETGGRERTKAEYQSLFEEAGWTIGRVLSVTDELSIMDCVKP
jgi:predicted transcriptional regulator